MTAKLAQHALHCEVTETGLEEEVAGVGIKDTPWKWLTVYEIENADKSTDAMYNQSNHPTMTEGMEEASFDIRAYEEIKRWQAGDWEGGM
jgi:hypothetical protein